MIYLQHSNGRELNSVFKNGKRIEVANDKLVKAFWELTARFPEELIIWRDDEIDFSLSDNWEEIFHHDLIMASYACKTQYLPESIGYIDQLPFVNPDYKVQYPSWRMSTDIGGIKGKVAAKFKNILGDITDFGYLLNSMAKIGQQNSLLCYSAPELTKDTGLKELGNLAGNRELFRFVAQHYKRVRLFVLFLCYIKYEKKFPVWSLLAALLLKSWFQENIKLREVEVESSKTISGKKTVDVIIPTMGRPEHVKEVLSDLREQILLPSKVIIVEQNPDENSRTQLGFIKENEWPFQIVHHFIHKTGACNARNLAMKSVEAEYIFFADDDIRFSKDLLSQAIFEVNRLGAGALNLNCILPGGKTIFPKIKQWGAFGSGTSLVRTEFALQCEFSELFEHGFGEDMDFGLQLRAKGCDIIYHPGITTIHLKAKEGGFRSISDNQWSTKNLEPKPSPTMMVLVKKYYSHQMRSGYKTELFLRYYRKQSIKNPLSYISRMRKRWKLSEKIADELINKASSE